MSGRICSANTFYTPTFASPTSKILPPKFSDDQNKRRSILGVFPSYLAKAMSSSKDQTVGEKEEEFGAFDDAATYYSSADRHRSKASARAGTLDQKGHQDRLLRMGVAIEPYRRGSHGMIQCSLDILLILAPLVTYC